MSLKATRRALDEVAARLPFHVEDVEAANEAFLRWRETERPEDLRIVELWTYCYTRHYFIMKFLRDGAYGPTDLDTLVTKSFTRARGNLERVSDPERFASWVSVICRNVFASFLRRRRERFTLNEDALADPPPPAEHDRLLALRAVESALAEMPSFLAEVARLRFLEDLPYDTIVSITGLPRATARAYVHRAARALRNSPAIRALFEELAP